jgi:uncharacterized protein (DUF1501 family)
MHTTRRTALLGLGSAVGLGRAKLALAAPGRGDRRFVAIILRGALDGMAAVVPYGDPALAGLRAPLVPPGPGGGDLRPQGGQGTGQEWRQNDRPAARLGDLGGFYGLHPALPRALELFRNGSLLVVHAVAGPWRVRSHFEAQDDLESGAPRRLDSGWLNRVLDVLPPPTSAPVSSAMPATGEAMAIGVDIPLLLRGPARVGSWAPAGFGDAPPDLYGRAAALAARDPAIGPALAEGLREHGFTEAALEGAPEGGPDRNPMRQRRRDRARGFAALAAAAGTFLARPDGPRIAALELDGWDTHVAQVPRLHHMLATLDTGLAALKTALGSAWAQTVVLTMTEFGRTARVNGTGGTDHGTASVAFLAGGAVAGGRVLADWPGLAAGRLFQDRDLAPTTDLRAVAKGVLAAHLGLDALALRHVFPGSAAAAPIRGLVRA